MINNNAGLGVQEGLTGEERQKAFDSVAAKAWAKKDAWRNNHVLVIDEVTFYEVIYYSILFYSKLF